ncbi:MAG TPA: imidazole glycerol phosphate synthase subunit HisH [Nitrospiria bacterium]
MISIVDYGMGNLRSVAKAFERLGFPARVTRDPGVIEDAGHVVLPGVGAFPDCMKNLDRYGLIRPVQKALESGKPFLGICLGLHLLFSESEEFGRHEGLGWIKGKVIRFPAGPLKVPHMGWNDIQIRKKIPLFNGLSGAPMFYFVHSYHAVPDDPDWVASTTEYGSDFVSGIARDNVFALQFHPEKSQKAGLAVLQNFALCK